jgi:Uma2 family endonuclease
MPILEAPTIVTPPPYVPSPDVPRPDASLLVVDDGAPVESLFAEKQQRLLVEPLYGCWTPSDGRPFRALCNVGLFHAYKEPPCVPDAMLALGVPPTDGIQLADNRSYFMWVVGKPPDVVIEVVSDTRGDEDSTKKTHYATIGVPYYVIFDPESHLRAGVLRTFARTADGYQPTDPARLPSIGLGLMLWDGEYEGETACWLRWTDGNGNPIPTTKQRADAEASRADAERKRANAEKTRANAETARADAEKARADEAIAKLKALEEQLKSTRSN